jgi:hypothetical protein
MQTATNISSLDLNTRIRWRNGQMTADLGGELAILNLETGVYFGLNEIGARIWSLLAEARTLREIRDVILDEYAVEESCCQRDLIKLMADLDRHQLVEVLHATDRQL